MTKDFCDFCGKEVKEKSQYLSPLLADTADVEISILGDTKDICTSCSVILYRALDQMYKRGKK